MNTIWKDRRPNAACIEEDQKTIPKILNCFLWLCGVVRAIATSYVTKTTYNSVFKVKKILAQNTCQVMTKKNQSSS